MKSIQVVAAIIYNPERDQVLISRRHAHLHQGGLWEFPGGKVEPDESHQGALCRELREEIGIDIHQEQCQLLLDVSHRYPDKDVHLHFWEVASFDGIAHGREGQEVRWVPIGQLPDYTFPEANLSVLELLLSSDS